MGTMFLHRQYEYWAGEADALEAKGCNALAKWCRERALFWEEKAFEQTLKDSPHLTKTLVVLQNSVKALRYKINHNTNVVHVANAS